MTDFTVGKPGKSIAIFSIPLILGNLFQQLYTLVNSAFVGNFLGVKELAALGSCYPIVFFITSMVLGIGTGGSIVVSHYFGAKDYKSIKTIIDTFYVFFISLGLIICLTGSVFADFIFSFLSLEEDVRKFAVSYFRIYMAGMFFSVIFHSAISILRGLGDSTTQLYFLIPANILNALLSYWFLGIRHFGIESSAWASVISQFMSFLALFIYLHYKHEFVKLPFKRVKINKTHLKAIINIGLPAGVQQSVVSLTQILILSLVVKFGTDTTAAYSSAMRVESIALLFVLNISQALTSFTGTNMGANLINRVKSGLLSSMKISVVISLFTFVVFYGFSDFLMQIFTSDKQVILIGKQYLHVSGIFWIIFCTMMMFTAFFRGLGKATVTMIISILTLLIVRFPVSWLLSMKFSSLGIWLGAPVSWGLGVVCYILIYKKGSWQKQKVIQTVSMCFLILLLLSCNKSNAERTVLQENSGTNKPALTDTITHVKYPKNEFISPLRIPISLAGSFAELRGSHFHSGLDIRTEGRIGMAVIAPMDGYVSRIKVQAFGGGKNLYITHPNGYTTVYMHLDSYCGKIRTFVRNYQYKNQCYTFDYIFKKPEIYVKKGDTIAMSGQTGMVQGPHLHFEVRDTKTECPINPLLFGFKVPDTIPPDIISIAVTADKNSGIYNSEKEKIINIKSINSPIKDTIQCYGNIYFSVLGYDRSKNSSQKNGVYKSELFIDNELYFSHCIDKFSFNDYGSVDAVINYPLYIKTGKRYLCSKKQDNSNLPFNVYKNKGILNVKEGKVYTVNWKLSDIEGNTSSFTFYIQGVKPENKPTENKIGNYKKTFAFNKDNTYICSDSSVIFFPQNSLYSNLDFEYSFSKGTYSNIHNIHNIYTPVKKNFTLKIQPYNINESIKSKYIIARIDNKGNKSYAGGSFKNGYIEAKVGKFGKYTVWIDTLPPRIQPLNFKNNTTIKNHQKQLKLKITDNLSGINTYNGWINGQWVLFEYNGKNDVITYNIDQTLKKGKNTLKITITDNKNNVKTVTYTVIK